MVRLNYILGVDASNLRQGGGRTHLIELLKHANPKKHGFSKIIVWGSKATLNLLSENEWLIKINPYLLEKGLLQRTIWQKFKLDKEFLKQECDILFIPGSIYTGKNKNFVTIHQNILPFDWIEIKRYGLSFFSLKLIILRYFQSRTFKNAQGIIFLSKHSKNIIENLIDISKPRKRVIHHGSNEFFLNSPKNQKDIKTFNFKSPFKIIYVSTIDFYKHQTNVIEAVGKLRDITGWQINLDFVGPANKKALKKFNQKVKLWDPKTEWIKYRGQLPYNNISEFYHYADLSLLASSSETFGMVLLESMASGLPIACSNYGPFHEILGEAGVYFDPEDPISICNSLKKLINSPELRFKNANIAYEKSKKFTWTESSDKTFNLITSLFENS